MAATTRRFIFKIWDHMQTCRFLSNLFFVGVTFSSGCAPSQPPVVSLPSLQAQKMSEGNSMLGPACSGQDVSDSLRLSGHSRYIVRINVDTLVADGFRSPYSTVLAPADEGITQMALPRFPERGGSCGGVALSTRVIYKSGEPYIDWRLEISPSSGHHGSDRAQPWLVTGRVKLNETKGTGDQFVAFKAFDRDFTGDITVTPGPVFIAEKRAQSAKDDEAKAGAPGGFLKAFPDEKAYKTLDSVTN